MESVVPSNHHILCCPLLLLPSTFRRIRVFPVVMYGCENWTIKKLSTEELMLLNCGVGEDS